jgi:hypothetical protein
MGVRFHLAEALGYKLEVVFFIPCGVKMIFYRLNPMIFGLTRPLTEISAIDISWRINAAGCLRLKTFSPSCANCLEILGTANCWSPHCLSRPVQGLLSTEYVNL